MGVSQVEGVRGTWSVATTSFRGKAGVNPRRQSLCAGALERQRPADSRLCCGWTSGAGRSLQEHVLVVGLSGVKPAAREGQARPVSVAAGTLGHEATERGRGMAVLQGMEFMLWAGGSH